MKPFEQELTRIEQNLTNEFRSLDCLITDYNMVNLQPVIDHVGKALLKFKEFHETDDREGCHVCSKPLDNNNYQMVDGKKTCSSECTKRLKKQIINENKFG